VVTATVAAADAKDVPSLFVAVTVIVYVTPEESVCTVIGDDDPEAVLVVCPAAAAVIVKDVAAGELSGREKETLAAPLLKDLPVAKFVAEILDGASGIKGPKDPTSAPKTPVIRLIHYQKLST
jgi:hypothetical protein